MTRPFTRRTFLGCTAASLASGTGLHGAALMTPAQTQAAMENLPMTDIARLPNYCSHEHWGSNAAIGMTPEGYRNDTEAGAVPRRTASIWDLVLDPYFAGWLGCAACNPDALAKEAGAPDFRTWWADQPEAALEAIRPRLEEQRFTGTFQCTRRGVEKLYGVDLAGFDAAAWQNADRAVAERLRDLFGWYRQAMRQAHFSALIRPVHPEYYLREDTPGTAAQERAFTDTVMRIDPLLELWPAECPRRDALAEAIGVDPGDAASWRAFIAKACDLAAEHNALGIKQLQAYTRPLEFQPREDASVRFRGALTPDEVGVFQDWVMHECCKQAYERGWPHQIHVGTHNLTQSGPLPLEALARRYPRMAVVMLHTWPFFEEAGWLAKHVHNCYIDTCWQPVLNPAFLRASLTQWINYVPSHKIMLAHDSTTVEMAVGSSLFTRAILEDVLVRQSRALGLGEAAAVETAAAMLAGNAVRVYGPGRA